MEGEVGRARQILLSGVDVNGQSQGATPAWIACYKGHTECLSLLINHGAQLDKADNKGATPAFIACQNGHTECLSLLINHGAQLDKADATGTTPAYIACQNGHVKILHLLIQHGADLRLADTSGRSPAHMASVIGRVKMLALIKRVNADLINHRDNRGRTPLFYARQLDHDDAVEWLIEHGAEEVGEPMEGAELEAIKVLSQLIQMHSIISHKALYLSHIIFSLYYSVQWRRARKVLDCCDWRLSIARTPTARQIEQPTALD
jgi:ankyrin repeat protein